MDFFRRWLDMKFNGFVQQEKNSQFWLIHLPALDLTTQGTSKDDAFNMLEDAILELVLSYLGCNAKRFLKLSIIRDEEPKFSVSANDSKILLSLALRRQQQMNSIDEKKKKKAKKSLRKDQTVFWKDAKKDLGL